VAAQINPKHTYKISKHAYNAQKISKDLSRQSSENTCAESEARNQAPPTHQIHPPDSPSSQFRPPPRKHTSSQELCVFPGAGAGLGARRCWGAPESQLVLELGVCLDWAGWNPGRPDHLGGGEIWHGVHPGRGVKPGAG